MASGTWLRVLPAFWPEQGWLCSGGQRLLMPQATSTTGSPTVHYTVPPLSPGMAISPILLTSMFGLFGLCAPAEGPEVSPSMGHTRLCTFITYCDDYKG